MIRVTMVNDIRKYETKMIGPFTKRQTICMIIGIVFGVLAALVLPLKMSDKLLVAVVCGAPIILCGYIKKNGRYLEELALFWVYRNLLTPKLRTARCKNHYRETLNEINRQEEAKKNQNMTPKERKTAQKKEVTYGKYKIFK